ncbi:MAG TPA: hypothetical protein VFF84_01515 [Sphingobium sp.]|nr:hypothetical protein [Sphingobium sp.]
MSFAYHRSLAPMMWAFFALVLVETATVHLIIALWWPALALALSIASHSVLVWLALLIRSFSRQPVLIVEGLLHWRCGSLRRVAVPLDQIAGLRAGWDGPLIKDRATFNAALIAWPNVVIDLKTPLPSRRRVVTRLAHKLDDRDAFAAAMTRLLAAS